MKEHYITSLCTTYLLFWNDDGILNYITCLNVVFYVVPYNVCNTRLKQMLKLQILNSVEEGFYG